MRTGDEKRHGLVVQVSRVDRLLDFIELTEVWISTWLHFLLLVLRVLCHWALRVSLGSFIHRGIWLLLLLLLPPLLLLPLLPPQRLLYTRD